MSAGAAPAAVLAGTEQVESARLLRELRQLRDDFRDELRSLTRLREDLEKTVEEAESASFALEEAVEKLGKAPESANAGTAASKNAGARRGAN